MSTTGPRYSKGEFKKRAEDIFEKDIRASLEGHDPRHFLAIDIETGSYEIDASEMKACDRLRSRVPDAQIWLRKVGSPFARRFGGRGKAAEA
jgi:hypothetical protein